MDSEQGDYSTREAALSAAKKALLEKRLGAGITGSPAARLISRRNTDTPPLSFAQQRLWLLDQLMPGTSLYNIAVVVNLSGSLDVAALRQSLNQVVARHEVLRTTFVLNGEQPMQRVEAAQELPLPVIDLPDVPESERDEAVRQHAREESTRPFDLARGPLVRAALLRLSPTEHVLLLTMHHIVSDGWSLGVIVREMSEFYRAACACEAARLPELPAQYADFAVWQREWLRGESFRRQLAYWHRQLADLPVLQLPTDRPRPAVQNSRGAHLSSLLSENLTKGLTSLSRRAGATLFMTLLAAFQLLLARYSGQTDIVVGTPVAGRTHTELEGLVGFFANTLVLRGRVSVAQSFLELLSDVREMTLAAYAHQEAPFERLVEELQPTRDMSRNPLFQVFFNLLNFTEARIDLPGLSLTYPPSFDTGSKFDLTLYAIERGARLELRLVYNTDLFNPARMSELMAQLEQLLAQVVERPDESVSRHSLITPDAAKLLPDPALPLAARWDGAIQTRLSQQSRRVPQSLAVTDGEDAWTYQELEARSNQLAQCLLNDGVKRGDVVAVYAHRSASLVWALLGVLKAGAAFCILDADYPALRLIDCLRLAAPTAWLQLEAAGEPPEALLNFVAATPLACRLQLPRLASAVARNFLSEFAPNAPAAQVEADTPAYVAFTSGTTGSPKAIIGTHMPLSHFMRWHVETFGLNESDRFSMLSGLSHDPLLRDIFTPLWVGATLCVPGHNDDEYGAGLNAWLRRQQISVAHMTPSLARSLAGKGYVGGDGQDAMPHALRYLFFGGEALMRSDVVRLRELAPSVQCVNFYGATETPQAVGYYVAPLDADPHQAADASGGHAAEMLPVGRGIDGAQLLVLNEAGRLAGVSELGEVHVRTPYLSRGYLSDDTLTGERFIPNPFNGADGDRLYKTGDLARYDPDGQVEIVGRRDGQMKVRGFRVEASEIEAHLRRHPEVREAVVDIVESAPGDRRLVAYVVPAREQLLTDDLRDHLAESLPAYMLPSFFVSLDALPLTPNGKLDRLALRDAGHFVRATKTKFVPPRDPTEAALTDIWQSLLGVESIGVEDDFFSLGGHSLLAAQMLARVRGTLGASLPLRRVFEARTIAQLAALVREAREAEPGTRLPPLVPVSRESHRAKAFSRNAAQGFKTTAD